jgi:hypothetical protein
MRCGEGIEECSAVRCRLVRVVLDTLEWIRDRLRWCAQANCSGTSLIMLIVGYLLIVLGGLISFQNWASIVVSYRSGRFVSAVPLVGGLLLGGGMALIPPTRPYAALAIVADYGTLIFILALPHLCYQIWSTSRFNLVHSFSISAAGRSITINLFHRHIAVIRVEFNPPVPCHDNGSLAQGFGAVGRWATTEAGFSIEGYRATRHIRLVPKENGDFTTVELNYPSEQRYNYDSLDGFVLRKQK